MYTALKGGMALAFLSTTALAGGIERTAQSVAPIFEDGNYLEFSIGSVDPSVSGSAGPANSGNMAERYTQVAFAYKHQFSENFSIAVIYDQPYGANVAYPTGTLYPFTDSTADLSTNALTILGRYKMDNGFSVHGGLRYQTMEATVAIPAVSNYMATGQKDDGIGYVVGAAYERPDIALRIALTYNSAIEHNFATSETTTALGGPNASTVTSRTPQSLNLEAQSGIAKDTLLFGSIRWVDWSEFDISPPDYATATGGGSLVSYANDTITYSLGVGRRFNANWSGSISISHEKALGGLASNLGPTDGKTGITIGAKYTKDNMSISGGINYTWIGDAQTALSATARSSFTDNSAVGIGVKVGYSF